METLSHSENNEYNYLKNQKSKLNKKKQEDKKQTNGTLFIIIVVAIVGFFLFKEINANEEYIKESILIEQSDDNTDIEMQGIDILDISTIKIDGNNDIIVSAYNGKTQKDIKPDEIKVITKGVTWLGKTSEFFAFNHYTLYITKEEYSALQEMLSLNNGGF